MLSLIYYFFTKRKNTTILNNMINPIIAKITSKFGEISSIRGGVPHNGVDLAVKIGTEVKSPFNGLVKSIYENNRGGKQMIVKLDNGFTLGLAHLEKNNLKNVGDKVKQGEVIALSGNTGKGTGAHLHLTLRNEANLLVNPEDYFTFRA